MRCGHPRRINTVATQTATRTAQTTRLLYTRSGSERILASVEKCNCLSPHGLASAQMDGSQAFINSTPINSGILRRGFSPTSDPPLCPFAERQALSSAFAPQTRPEPSSASEQLRAPRTRLHSNAFLKKFNQRPARAAGWYWIDRSLTRWQSDRLSALFPASLILQPITLRSSTRRRVESM